MSVQEFLEDFATSPESSLKRSGTASTKYSSSSNTECFSCSKSPSIDSDFESYASTIGYDRRNYRVRSYASNGMSLGENTLQSLFESDSSYDESECNSYRTIEPTTKNRSLSLQWNCSNASTSQSQSKGIVDDACELPEGISKSDIMVTIDIDDEARSSRAEELDEENLDVEILHHKKRNSGENSPRKLCHGLRRKFEEDVLDGIIDDFKSVYTATPKTAKLVLCVVVSVLSDGTLDHTFWSGGRVGLTEVVLQWVLFDANDLQVYKRGRVVQKKDFGFGSQGLTENEGQLWLRSWLVPRATAEVISMIGKSTSNELLAEF